MVPEASRLWSTDIGRAVASAPAIGDSAVIVQETGGRLIALGRVSGRRLWQRRLSGPGAASPLLDSETILAATGGRNGAVYSVRLANGTPEWNRVVGPVTDPIAASAPTVFAATEIGRVVAIERGRGGLLWQRQLGARVRSGVTLTSHGLVLITDDSLYLLSATDGRTVASAATPATALAPPAAWERTLVVAFPSGTVIAFDLADLHIQWRIETSGTIVAPPAIARDTVFVVTLDGPTDLGVSIRSPAAPIRQGVLVGAANGEVLWFDGNSPAPRWQIRVDGPIDQAPVLNRGTLLVADGRGRLHVWK
jgi:outer membrane protein assembly factor BamB